jgi:hypothetical protein
MIEKLSEGSCVIVLARQLYLTVLAKNGIIKNAGLPESAADCLELNQLNITKEGHDKK